MSDSVAQRIQALVRADIRNMSAYHVPDSSGMLKLDAMENPFPWPGSLPQAMQQQWLETLQQVSANRYPDPQCAEVKQQLKNVFAAPEGCELLIGNGSDEIIQLLIQALATEKSTVMAPEPGFVMYKVLADINRVNFLGVTLQDDFELDMPAILSAISDYQPQLIFLACPNNPTGNCWSLENIEEIANAANGLVVVDEAYSSFTEQTAMPLALQHNNLVVMRTLSKIGLAGLRLGYLVGVAEWIHEFEKIRMPYNINVLTQASVSFALQHFDFLEKQTAQLKENRQRLMAQLSEIDAIKVFPSQANFALVRVPEGKAGQTFTSLKQQGVLIKNLDGGHPLLKDCLRITVSTEEENSRFLSAFRNALDK